MSSEDSDYRFNDVFLEDQSVKRGEFRDWFDLGHFIKARDLDVDQLNRCNSLGPCRLNIF